MFSCSCQGRYQAASRGICPNFGAMTGFILLLEFSNIFLSTWQLQFIKMGLPFYILLVTLRHAGVLFAGHFD